ncbi:aminoacyl-tRNA hydrolase [candidate division KSB1 bacterium]
MYCIVGLGNPESKYSFTRHNIGFRVADQYAETLGCTFNAGKGEYIFAKGYLDAEQVMILKPVTYMNRSGFAVQHAVSYYNIDISKILIVLDELDLPFGTFRFRRTGSDGGNKGLRSIITQLGTEDFSRLRIGIRNRDKIANPSSYVLSKFAKAEENKLPELLDNADSAVECFIKEGIREAMNRFNKRFEFSAK